MSNNSEILNIIFIIPQEKTYPLVNVDTSMTIEYLKKLIRNLGIDVINIVKYNDNDEDVLDDKKTLKDYRIENSESLRVL